MKFIRLSIIALLLLLGASQAGAEVVFRLLPLKHTEDIDAAAVSTIESKLATAFTRVEALTENPEWALVIEPEIIFDEITQTEGMIREVARAKGELVLTAKNIFDGHTFATATMPLTATAAGGEAKAMKALASSVKPTAPVFVRFTKQARQRIGEYYAANCSSILSQAQTLVSTGRPEAAYSLLAAIEPSLDCYDAASALMIELHNLMTPAQETSQQPEADTTEPAPAVEELTEPAPSAEPEPEPVPAEPETAVEEQPAEPVPAAAPAAAPVEVTTPVWTAKVKSSAPDKFKAVLKSIDFDPENERLIIVVGYTNLGLSYERNVNISCQTIVYGNGDLADSHDVTINGDKYCSFDAPKGIAVNLRIVINHYGSKPVPVSIVKFSTAGSELDITDIHIEK